MLKKLRILPLLIIFSFVMLSIRVGNVFTDVQTMSSGIYISQAVAAGAPAKEEEKEESSDEEAEEEEEIQPKESLFDLSDITDAELDVLETLVDRKNQINENIQKLEEKEKELNFVEKRVDEKVSELQRIEKNIRELIEQKETVEKTRENNENEKIQSLVKIYESMKPADAARIFEELELEILLDVIAHMKEKKVANILAKMDPLKARFVTEQLVEKYRSGS